jgi:transcriptional regulator with XRE-family HTH domain
MEQLKIPRCRQKIMLPETIALRKMRNFLKLDRKSAAILIEKSSKQLEKIENGYVEVTPQLINHFVTNYGFSLKNYELLVAGKVEQVKNSLCPKKEKVLENNSLRRSYKKVIIKEARALQVLRRLQGLTQYKASYLCGYSRTAIGHIENGRIEIPKSRICHIVKSYGFTMKDFEYHMKADVFVTEIQDDCISIIKALGEDKLKVVFPLLSTFKN